MCYSLVSSAGKSITTLLGVGALSETPNAFQTKILCLKENGFTIYLYTQIFTQFFVGFRFLSNKHLPSSLFSIWRQTN